MLHRGQSHSKTLHNKKPWLFWVFIIVSIPLAILLITYAAGYRFDQTTNSIVETSAVAIHTTPKQATIYLNGEQQADSTPFIEILEPGAFDIGIRKDGYYAWNKTLTILPGQSLLFPEITLLKESEAEATTTQVSEAEPLFRDLTEAESAELEALGRTEAETLQILSESGKDTIVLDNMTSSSYFVTELNQIANEQTERRAIRITDAEWLDDVLAYTDGLEIWLYHQNEQTQELFVRQSQTITDLAWHPDGSLLFYSDSNGLHAIELDERDVRQRWTISTIENASQITISDRERLLQFVADETAYDLVIRD